MVFMCDDLKLDRPSLGTKRIVVSKKSLVSGVLLEPSSGVV